MQYHNLPRPPLAILQRRRHNMEQDALFYILPFFKNLAILYVTVFVLYLGTAMNKTGIATFNFVFWLEQNKTRFIAGASFILALSGLMALTDVSPLFKFFGFDINASPVGLGLAIALSLGFISTKQTKTKKGEKAKEIQAKAVDIVQASTEIVNSETKKVVAKKPVAAKVSKPKAAPKKK